ncbi:MAG: hypothetical protein IDH49_02005 [Gammaproteobacteria bacterium]|nr:hypothetical protein [Gammaproteobacteria bacterium]
MGPQQWRNLMRRLALYDNLETYQQLYAAYSQRHRYYHGIDHIASCLRELESTRTVAKYPEQVEIALWFHDAVYTPMALDNEERSAIWATQFLASADASPDTCARVQAHILATRHNVLPDNPDSALVVDIDLAILGQESDIYECFEQTIRAEYQRVPWPVYRRKRHEILLSFLERDSIYSTPCFRERYEAAARRNMQVAIEMLESPDEQRN